MRKLARKQKNWRENEKTSEKMRKLARKWKNWRENRKTARNCLLVFAFKPKSDILDKKLGI